MLKGGGFVVWNKNAIIAYEASSPLGIAQYILVDSVLFPPLHNCTSTFVVFFNKGINAGKRMSSQGREHPWENWVCVFEGENVWLWKCDYVCADNVQACLCVSLSLCVHVVISTIWRAFARGIKMIGFRRCLYSINLLTRRLQTAAIFFQEDILWPPRAVLLVALGFSSPGSLAEVRTCRRLHSVC